MIDTTDVEQDIKANTPGFTVETISFEGMGDFCLAYTVNESWIFRFAYNAEGSRSLEVERILLPKLAKTVSLPVPNPVYFGRQRQSDFCLVGYRKIEGVELTNDLLQGLEPDEQERCALDLARSLRELHSFSLDEAVRSGVLWCDYPFCRTETEVIAGTAEEIYTKELARLVTYPQVGSELRAQCEGVVTELLEQNAVGELPPALVHGDLSQDHVLFDPVGRRITGVIDFTDVIISTPLLDLTYLHYHYGRNFLTLVLRHYYDGDGHAIIERVRLLLKWYMAIRLLWALDHEYPPGIERGLWALNQVIASPSA